MSIVLARVDDRLIHGQVMTSWLNYTPESFIHLFIFLSFSL